MLIIFVNFTKRLNADVELAIEDSVCVSQDTLQIYQRRQSLYIDLADRQLQGIMRSMLTPSNVTTEGNLTVSAQGTEEETENVTKHSALESTEKNSDAEVRRHFREGVMR